MLERTHLATASFNQMYPLWKKIKHEKNQAQLPGQKFPKHWSRLFWKIQAEPVWNFKTQKSWTNVHTSEWKSLLKQSQHCRVSEKLSLDCPINYCRQPELATIHKSREHIQLPTPLLDNSTIEQKSKQIVFIAILDQQLWDS